MRGLEGRPAWLPALDGAFVAEAKADDHMDRAIARDPDLRVIEIEDRDRRHPFEEMEN